VLGCSALDNFWTLKIIIIIKNQIIKDKEERKKNELKEIKDGN